MEDMLLKDVEVARILRISRGLLWRLLVTGELPSVKIGKCRRIPRQAVDAYIRRLLAEQNRGEGGV
jgi:excisionase family DNA binding protein